MLGCRVTLSPNYLRFQVRFAQPGTEVLPGGNQLSTSPWLLRKTPGQGREDAATHRSVVQVEANSNNERVLGIAPRAANGCC